jgi:NADH-quinone oxidoreductase subunit H
MGFALFFLGEYGNILMMCGVISIFFLGGWLPPFAFLSFIPGSFWFSLKILFFACLFILARAMLPRFRYDQLMYLGWKIFIPLTLGWLFFIAGILVSFDSLSNIFYLN